MSWRSIAIMALSALALGIFSLVGDGADPRQGGAGESRALPGLSAGSVREVRIQTRHAGQAGETRLKREGEGWRLIKPVADRADAAEVEHLLSAAEFLEPMRILRGVEPPPGAGLERPVLRLTLWAPDQEHHAEVGAADASGLGVYVKTWTGSNTGAARLMVAPKRFLSVLESGPSALRDHQLIPLRLVQTKQVAFNQKHLSWSMTRASGEGWNVNAGGLNVRGNDLAIRRLLTALLNLRAANIVGESAAIPLPWISVLGRKGERVDLSLAGQCPGRTDRRLLRVKESSPPRQVWACIAAAEVSALSPAPSALQDLRLTLFEEPNLAKVMVHMETRTVLLERGARGWSILNDGGSVAVDGAVVRALTLGLGQVKAEPAAGADRGLQLAVITMENEAGRKEILTFWERRGGGLLVKRATADGLLLAVPVSTLDIAKTALATTGR